MMANDDGRDLASRAPGRAMGLIGVSLWAGLVVGLLDVTSFLLRVPLTQGGFYRRSPNVLWMIPVSSVVLFGIAGGLLRAMIRPIPKVGGRLSWWLLCVLVLATSLLTIPGLRLSACLTLAIGISAWMIPVIRARIVGSRRIVRASLAPLLLAVLVLGGISYTRDQPLRSTHSKKTAPKGAPNVLFIVMDTVRADATSLIAGGIGSTPRLAALAERGARFENAIATGPWTLPSHSSMFTGMSVDELNVGPNRALDSTYPTLAGYLGRNGYATGGFVANMSFCAREYGLSRGFDHYEDFVISPLELFRSSSLGWLISRRLVPVLDRLRTATGREACHPLETPTQWKSAAEVNREALGWIEAQRDRPFFAFLNYIDAHAPYLVPEKAPRPFTGHPDTLAERRSLREWTDDTPCPRAPEDVALARDAYHDSVAYLDARIGDLIDELDRLGRLENTVIVVTADHGEHFGEHVLDGLPLFGHRFTVYQPEVHVPLLIVAPGHIPAGTVVDRAVSLRDLPATVVDLVGLGKGSPFPGQSLVDPSGATPGRPASASFSLKRENGGGPATDLMQAVVADGKSYYRYADGREELYDLATDPAEAIDLSHCRARAGLLREFRAALDDPETFD